MRPPAECSRADAVEDMRGMSMGDAVADVVPEVVLLVGAVAVLLAALVLPRRHQRWPAAMAIAAMAAAAATTGAQLGGEQRMGFFGTYALDDAAVVARLVILAVAALCALLSIEWFATDDRGGEYQALLCLAALGAMLLAGAADLMELILGALLSSVTGYVLTAYHRASARSTEAGVKYYLLGALTNAALVYGAALLFGLAGTTTFSGLRAGLIDADPVALVAGFVLVVVGLAFKIGAVPAHAWVPDVADGAPAPVSAFLTIAPKVGGLVALARLVAVLPEHGVGWRPVVAALALATMTLGNLAALAQDDARRLLGWSAVSQSGYGLMALVALGRSDLAVPSLVFFTAAYGAANLAAFGVVVQLRGRAALVDYAGLARARPLLAVALGLSLLSLVGVPPLAGFPAKVALFAATVDAGYAWLAIAAVLNTVISLAYYLRWFAPVVWEGGVAPGTFTVLGRNAAAGTVIATCAVVLLGIGAEVLFSALDGARLLPGL